MLGWTIYRVSKPLIQSGEAVDTLRELIQNCRECHAQADSWVHFAKAFVEQELVSRFGHRIKKVSIQELGGARGVAKIKVAYQAREVEGLVYQEDMESLDQRSAVIEDFADSIEKGSE